MLNLKLPQGFENQAASVFDQQGNFIMAGKRNECETHAKLIKGLFCLNKTNKPRIHTDFLKENQISDMLQKYGYTQDGAN